MSIEAYLKGGWWKIGDAIQLEVDGQLINGFVTWIEMDAEGNIKVKATFTGIPIITYGICSEGSNV